MCNSIIVLWLIGLLVVYHLIDLARSIYILVILTNYIGRARIFRIVQRGAIFLHWVLRHQEVCTRLPDVLSSFVLHWWLVTENSLGTCKISRALPETTLLRLHKILDS